GLITQRGVLVGAVVADGGVAESRVGEPEIKQRLLVGRRRIGIERTQNGPLDRWSLESILWSGRYLWHQFGCSGRTEWVTEARRIIVRIARVASAAIQEVTPLS